MSFKVWGSRLGVLDLGFRVQCVILCIVEVSVQAIAQDLMQKVCEREREGSGWGTVGSGSLGIGVLHLGF